MQLLNFVKSSKEVVQQVITQNVITTANNKIVYESEDIIRFYTEQNDLQKPETTILTELRNKLPKMSMLDIGVGASEHHHTLRVFSQISRNRLLQSNDKRMRQKIPWFPPKNFFSYG